MDCASCLDTIRRSLEKRSGVVAVEGSPISRRLEIDYDPATVDAEAIRREVSDLGYRVLAPSTATESTIKIWSSRRALRGRVLDMHVLMLLAVIGAIAIGEYMEAAAIAFLFSVAELLEGFASERAEASVRSLMEMSPDVARVRRDGVEVTMRAAEVGPGGSRGRTARRAHTGGRTRCGGPFTGQ